MGIKSRFTKEDVKRLMEVKLAQLEQAIINRLIFVGENFVANARNNHTYLDQTGNLTSSIGYLVLKKGSDVKSNYKGNAEGVQKAKSLAEELKPDFVKGYTLIVFAGMDYAAAVESRGRDVLTASSIIAKRELKQAIKNIKNKLKNK